MSQCRLDCIEHTCGLRLGVVATKLHAANLRSRKKWFLGLNLFDDICSSFTSGDFVWLLQLPMISHFGAVCFVMLPFSTELYQKNGDVMLMCKAYNGRVVMQWLAETISHVAQQDLPGADDMLTPVALCMSLASGFHLFIIEKQHRFP